MTQERHNLVHGEVFSHSFKDPKKELTSKQWFHTVYPFIPLNTKYRVSRQAIDFESIITKESFNNSILSKIAKALQIEQKQNKSLKNHFNKNIHTWVISLRNDVLYVSNGLYIMYFM